MEIEEPKDSDVEIKNTLSANNLNKVKSLNYTENPPFENVALTSAQDGNDEI